MKRILEKNVCNYLAGEGREKKGKNGHVTLGILPLLRSSALHMSTSATLTAHCITFHVWLNFINTEYRKMNMINYNVYYLFVCLICFISFCFLNFEQNYHSVHIILWAGSLLTSLGLRLLTLEILNSRFILVCGLSSLHRICLI